MTNETKRKKPSLPAYFKNLGIKDYKSERGFWKHVTEVDPILAKELEPLISRQKQGSLYDVKNNSLPFSLAVESWTMSFHKAFLQWVNTQRQLRPQRILDIGCDNGLLTCWYATLFPEAEVFGIDQASNGIQRAKELSNQLDLHNLNFQKMDFSDLIEHFSENFFDLIISVRCFHEIMGPLPIPQYWSLPDYLEKNPTFGDSNFLRILHYLLTEDGTYLSCERLDNPADVGKWANVLEEANLYVQWEKSDVITYHELGIHKRSPVILTTKRNTGMTTWDGLEHLYTKGKPITLEVGSSYSGAQAEFAYHRLGEKSFNSGVFLNMKDHWYLFRFEIWETRDLLLVYSYGNMGHRHLDILPTGAYEEAQLLRDEAIAQFSHLGPITPYDSIEERPE
nr:class I SAM-dependent methyltransferase [Neobacillus sp. Marseille-Q6967]